MINKEKIKKINNKGMTLIEVIASVAILAIIFIPINNGTNIITNGFKMGKLVYQSNGDIERILEEDTVVVTTGNVTFKVNGSPTEVKVDGNYHTYSVTKDDITISYTMFRP